MEEPLTEQPVTREYPSPKDDARDAFCPECGQSLDLARHEKATVKRRSLEPYVFLVFGLCLTVVFGLRTGNTISQFSSLDQQIAALRVRAAQGTVPKPGNPAMIVADTMSEVMTEQIDQQVAFQRDVTGLGFGLFTLVVGAVSWLHERPEVVEGRRRRMIAHRLVPSSRPRAGGNPWDLGGLVAITIARMLLLIFVTIIGLQLLRGVPPSLQLVDQALMRTVAAVVSIVGIL